MNFQEVECEIKSLPGECAQKKTDTKVPGSK